MGIKIKKITEDLPVEEGKSYDTKNSQGLFLVTKVLIVKGKQIVRGTYLKDNLENCPIDVGRLVTDKVVVSEEEICDCCSFPIKDKHVGKFIVF